MGNTTSDPYCALDPVHRHGDNPMISEDPFSPMSARQLVRTAFNAIWSIKPSASIPPPSRTGHWTVYLEDRDIAVVGYGMGNGNATLNDVWALQCNKRQWSHLNVDPSSVSPRTGSTAICYQNTVFIFGGFADQHYLSDFHAISLQSLTVSRPAGPYTGPAGRSGHVMASKNGKIMIWGGYNGDWLNDMWIYDIATCTWREIECSVQGRTSATYCNHGDYCYIFGASKVDGLLRFNWTTETIEVLPACGSVPGNEISSASLVAFDQYLLLQGGKWGKKQYGYLYGYDTRRQRWFVFHVHPDESTTTKTDGYIDDMGYFMVPRTSCVSSVFRKQDRSVTMFLGTPFVEPPMLSIAYVGDALGFLHLQTDMLSQLDFSKQ